MAMDLFDAAAEREAMRSGRPLSQERAEIIAPAPSVPADGLFAAAPGDVASALVVAGTASDTFAVIRDALAAFPTAFHKATVGAKVRIRPLKRGEKYNAASAELKRLGIDVDAWPVPPAGLFVVVERTIYASYSGACAMTIAHEYGHAVDCALGGGTYFSAKSKRVRRAYAEARRVVTPYAASGLDEFFAESLRAFVEVNDARSPWPKATRARLEECSPDMAALFAELAAGAPPVLDHNDDDFFRGSK